MAVPSHKATENVIEQKCSSPKLALPSGDFRKQASVIFDHSWHLSPLPKSRETFVTSLLSLSSNTSWQRRWIWRRSMLENPPLKSCATSSTGLLDPDGVAPREGEKWRSKQRDSSPTNTKHASTSEDFTWRAERSLSHHSPVKLTCGSDFSFQFVLKAYGRTWKLFFGSIPRSTLGSFPAQHSFSQKSAAFLKGSFGNDTGLLWKPWRSCKSIISTCSETGGKLQEGLLANSTPDPLAPCQPSRISPRSSRNQEISFWGQGSGGAAFPKAQVQSWARMLRREPWEWPSQLSLWRQPPRSEEVGGQIWGETECPREWSDSEWSVNKILHFPQDSLLSKKKKKKRAQGLGRNLN